MTIMEYTEYAPPPASDRERFLMGALQEREEAAAMWFSLLVVLLYAGLLYAFRGQIARFLVRVGRVDG
jgi:hypothetical protein